MDPASDGWGPTNIDRVFAHETGHVFGAPDEYASSNCTCGGAYGPWGEPNSNCENCPGGAGWKCVMDNNDWAFCPWTPLQIGWSWYVPEYYQGDGGSGIGGYNLMSPADLAFPYDYDSSGKVDHLVPYRPNRGAIFIVSHPQPSS